MKQTEEQEPTAPGLALRGSVGGVLMGLANLVPGISGGTMLLAAGVYPRFITAVAEVTTLRFRRRSLLLLAVVAIAALLALVLLAGPVKHLVTEYRWVMYSLFIGLTLGGVPLVWRMASPPTRALYGGAVIGFLLMALMAFGYEKGASGGGYALLFVAGVAGAMAMVLPGVSGAYLLLVLGCYETILGALDQCKRGLAGEGQLLLDAMHVVVPVGIGVAAGIVGISNLVRWALRRHEQTTLGILLGLLFGAVLGIWPFQEAVAAGEPRVYFTPTVLQVAAAVGLIAVGFSATRLIDRLGR
jgi:putative membrane protein